MHRARQSERLAEMVTWLTDCSTDEARAALRGPSADRACGHDEALARVARAIVAVQKG